MAVEYLCKVCRGHLNVKTSIILAAAKLSDRITERTGLS